MNNQKRILYFIIGLKLLLSLVAAWGYFTNPHIIRQVDTMGATLMYANKFSHGISFFNFLPTSLGIGDLLHEVTPMEFPLLNLVLSPIFLIPWKYNFALAHMVLIFINYFLVYLIFRVVKEKSLPEMKNAVLLLPLYGMSLLYIDRFMPDAMAFLLCSLSMLWMWNKKNLAGSVALGALGMLMKPPVAVVYAVFLLLPPKRWPKLVGPLMITLIPVFFYYLWGMDHLKALSHMDLYFAVDMRNPIDALIGFFSQPKKIFTLIFKDTLYRYSIIFIIVGIFISHKKKNITDRNLILKLLGVFVVQIVLLALINGDHSFIHSYYMIGTSFVACWMLALVLKQNKKLLMVGIIFLLATNMERSIYRLRPLWKGSIRSEARELIKKVPELRNVTKIRTEYSPIPRYGLVFNKICNSKTAHFGIYPKKYSCLNVRAQTQTLKVCEF